MFKKVYTYQLYGNSEIYSSRLKAHKRLCNMLGKNEEDFLPYKENRHSSGGIEIHYPNGHTIVKRLLL